MIDKRKLNNYQRAQSTKQYSLYVNNSKQVLNMRLQIRQKNYLVSIYEANLISLSQYQKLKQLCDTFEDVKQYIKNAQNTRIDLKNKVITITQTSSLKRNKIIELASIKFEHKQTNKIQISEVIAQKCSVKGQISSDEVKNMFELLAFTLQEQIINLRKKLDQKQEEQSLISRRQFNQQMNKIMKQLYIPSQKQMANGQNLQKQKSLKFSIAKINRQIQQINDKINQSNSKYLSRTDIDIQVNQQIKKFKQSILSDCIIQAQKIISNKFYEFQGKSKVFPSKHLDNQKYQKEVSNYGLQKSYSSAEIKIKNQPKVNWVDETCCHFSRLIINNNIITLNKQDAHIFGRLRILKHPTFSIFVKRMQRIMGLGIIDSQYKSKASMGSPPNALVYYKDGCYNGKQRKFHEGIGFKQGQTVTISVQRQHGRVQWKVGDSLRYSLQNQSIKNEKIQWVPYVYLMDKDVIVISD